MRTQKEIIRQRLIRNMPVSTIGAVNGKYGTPILRLAGLIFKLKSEGLKIECDRDKHNTAIYYLKVK